MSDEQVLQDRQRFVAENSGDGWVAFYDKALGIFVTAWYDKHGAFMYADGLHRVIMAATD